MRRAARTDSNHADVVSGLRNAGWKVTSTAALGGGFPDVVALSPDGTVWLFEIKTPDGGAPERHLTPMQVQFNRYWTRCKTLLVITSAQEAIDAYNAGR